MTLRTKHRSDEVGQVDERLAISVQLGIPTYTADPTPSPTDAEGGYANTPIYWNTALGSLRLNPGGLGWQSLGAVSPGSGIDITSGIASLGAPVTRDTDLDGVHKTRIGDITGGKSYVSIDPANSQAVLQSLSGGVSAFSGAYGGNAQMGVSQPGAHSYVYVDPSQMVVSDTINSRGLINGGDYEANFVARSLVTYQWASAQNALYMPKTGGTFTGDVQITTPPVNGTSAINKNYADSIAMGVVWIGADTDSGSNVTLSGEQVLSGYLTSNSRAFLHGQTNAANNGVWLTSGGAWTRTSDASTPSQLVRCAVIIDAGNNAGQTWLNTNSSIVLGTTAITFTRAGGLNYINGTGIAIAASTISLDLTYTDARYALNSWGIQSFTTSGSSGTPTFSGGTLNVPAYTLTGLGGQAALVSGTNIKNINSASLLGGGNIALQTPLVAGTDYLTPTGSAAGLVSFPTFNQNTTGNSATSTKLATGRSIQGVLFDGTSDISILNGTGLVRMAGTSISYDNSTYITSAGADGLYLPLHGTADNSALWNGLAYYGGGLVASVLYAMAYDGTNNRQGPANAAQMQGWLGLGSAAYLNASASAAANAVVQRDGSGYINNTYILTTDDSSSALGYMVGKSPSDNYHRTYAVGTVQSWLGLGARAYDSAAYLPLHAEADNSALWNGNSYTPVSYSGALQYILGYDQSASTWKPSTAASISYFLGLGSNAFDSAAYLPLHSTADAATLWGGQQANLSTTVSSIANMVAQQPGGSVAVASLGQVQGWLGLGSNAYNSTAYLPLHAKADSSATADMGYAMAVQDFDRPMSVVTPNFNGGHQMRLDFVNSAVIGGATGNFGGVVTLIPYDGNTASTGDASYQLGFVGTGANGSGTPRMVIRKGIDATWNGWHEMLTDSNYSSYSPTLTGGGASGVWGISVTGNAATANSATTAGSAGNSTLWNGYDNQFASGVRSDIAPSSINGFYSNGHVYQFAANQVQSFLGLGTAAYLNATTAGNSGAGANQVVRYDGSGYIQAYYINSDSPSSEGGPIGQFVTTNGSDNYYRRQSLSAVASTIATAIGLGGYLPLSGGTLTGALSGTTANFNANVNIIQQGSDTIGVGSYMQIGRSDSGISAGVVTQLSSAYNMDWWTLANGGGWTRRMTLANNGSGLSLTAGSYNGVPFQANDITGVQNAPFWAGSLANPGSGQQTFMPVIGQYSVVSGVGGAHYMSIGTWRSGNSGYTGAVYIAPGGGSDSYSTDYFLLSHGGAITHSSGTTFLNSVNYGTWALPLSAGASYPLTNTLYLSTTEGARTVSDAGYLSFYNSADSSRTGYIQFNAGSGVYIAAENATSINLQGAPVAINNTLTVTVNGAVNPLHVVNNISSGYTGTMLWGQVAQATGTAFDLIGLYTSTNTQRQFSVSGAGQMRLDGAMYGTSAYHQLNRNALTTENMFVWRTAGTEKWYFGQRNKNSEDGLSLYNTAYGDDNMYFHPNGTVDFSGNLNFSTWNGLTYAATSSPNNIVQYNGSGYIFANYFNTPSGGGERNASGLGYVAGFNSSDTYIRSYNSSAVAGMLGLGTAAYSDKTQLWSVSHPTAYYISNTWDGTYWQLTSNHPAAVNVGHATNADHATSAAYAAYLPTNYIGGVQTNPQTYFGNGAGLQVAMTGSVATWSDTLWINGYAGGDVPNMVAMHFLRNGTPRAFLSTQQSTATAYGSYYEFLTEYNWNNYAPSLTGAWASGSWGINITGSSIYSGSSGYSQYVDLLAGRTDAASYPVLWGVSQGTNPHTGNPGTFAFSCAAVTINSSTGTLSATNLSASNSIGVAGSPGSTLGYYANGQLFGGWEVLAGYYIDPSNGAYRAPNGAALAGYYFQTYNGAATQLYVGLTGTYAGRVGIGTTTPGYNLDAGTGNIGAGGFYSSASQSSIWGYGSSGTGSGYSTSDWGVWSARSGGPTLGFHYQGVVASTIGIEASGRIAIRNNPGTGYENFIANNIQAASALQADRVFAGYDSGVSGSVSASGWFRCSGPTGLYNASYAVGIYAGDASTMHLYGSSGSSFGLKMSYNGESSTTGYLYGDSSGFGLLTTSGGWGLRMTGGGDVQAMSSVSAPVVYSTSDGFHSQSVKGIAGNYVAQGNTQMIIWTIGDSWNTLANMYGLTYTYGATFSDHEISIAEAGTVNISFAMGGRGWFRNDVTASAFYQSSSRSLKTAIRDTRINALDLVRGLRVRDYVYRERPSERRVGVIAEEAPREFLSQAGDSVNLQDSLMIALKAIQELNAKVEDLQCRLGQA
jgi:hypothetical protein